MRAVTRVQVSLALLSVVVAMACGTPANRPSGQADALLSPGVPRGTIVAFYGTEIPAGWVLCDGRTTASGRLTPDLRNRFIMGLEPGTGSLGEIGGTPSHTHGARLGRITESTKVEKGNDEKVADDDHVHPVVIDAAQHLPPYVKLVYIMKD